MYPNHRGPWRCLHLERNANRQSSCQHEKRRSVLTDLWAYLFVLGLLAPVSSQLSIAFWCIRPVSVAALCKGLQVPCVNCSVARSCTSWVCGESFTEYVTQTASTWTCLRSIAASAKVGLLALRAAALAATKPKHVERSHRWRFRWGGSAVVCPPIELPCGSGIRCWPFWSPWLALGPSGWRRRRSCLHAEARYRRASSTPRSVRHYARALLLSRQERDTTETTIAIERETTAVALLEVISFHALRGWHVVLKPPAAVGDDAVRPSTVWVAQRTEPNPFGLRSVGQTAGEAIVWW